MTKETKIGLLVGLGVIIFIGILISDHLSVAQQQQPADLSQDGVPQRGQSATSQNTWTMDQHNTPLPPSIDEQLAVNTNTTDHAVINNDNIGSLNRLGNDFHPDDLRIDTSRDGIPPRNDDPTTRTLGNTPPVNPPTRDKIHFVESGDSLYKIAQKYYGDGSYYQSIYEANKDKMRSPADLRLGVRLVIPDRGGNTVTPPVVDETTRTVPPPPGNETPTTTGTKEYTIQKGDMLGVLAQKFCGTSRAWPKLVELNRGVIKDPDHLVAGTVIKVPK